MGHALERARQARRRPLTTRITWRGTHDALTRADTVLSELLDPPADAVSLVKNDAAEADAETGWQLYAYFEAAPDPAAVEAALTNAGLTIGPGEAETLEDRDWVAHALEGLGVVRAGPFVVFGSHDAAKAAAIDGLPIQVEANRAFGTGHHPTTEGCLAMLASIEDALPETMLDLGTGSGLLAIAARRLWPQVRVTATDIDAPSVLIAEENAEANGVQGIVFREAEGVDEGVRRAGPYDLVAANILAEPLIGLAPDIADVLAPGGRVILAGLLARQAAGVRDAYAAVGLSVVRQAGDAWPVLLLRKHADGAA